MATDRKNQMDGVAGEPGIKINKTNLYLNPMHFSSFATFMLMYISRDKSPLGLRESFILAFTG